MNTTLAALSIGQEAKIKKISGHGPLRRRLTEMGVTADSPVEVLRVAPLGDPIEVRIKGYSLSLRKIEAQQILVSYDPD